MNRFWDKVKIGKLEECWPWTASVFSKTGYGAFGIGTCRKDAKTTTAHRVSYELVKGSIPKGFFVLHHCDNRRCVNPHHLFVGTQKDNIQDMLKKGRNRYVAHKGEQNGSAKLSELDVRNIRMALQRGYSLNNIAKIVGTSKRTILRIKQGVSWKHVI